MLDIISPINGELLSKVPKDTPSSIKEKIDHAKKAFPAWRDLGIKKRASYFIQYHKALSDHKNDLIDLIHKENGKTKNEALAEFEKALELTEFALSLPQVMIDTSLEVSKGVRCTMSYAPLGVVACVAPFNFPLMIPHWTVPIALMAGNTVLLKPSEAVPLSAIQMLDLFHEIGLPKGVFQLVQGTKEAVLHLCEDEQIQAVSFVGSSTVARSVYQTATSHGKRALCLGSAKNHLLVLPDAHPEMTARDVVASMSGMAGQRCMAASVLILVGDCNHILEKIVTQAKNIVCGENLGAITNLNAKKRITDLVASAETEGAKILLDGRGVRVTGLENGYYFGPTVIDQVKPHMRVAKEEIFGPVLSVIRVSHIDEAIAIQNSSVYGNGASIYTQNGAMAQYVSERLDAGMIGVNIGVPVPREPFSFGGTKASKFGTCDITGHSSIEFWTRRVKQTVKWNPEAGVNWMS